LEITDEESGETMTVSEDEVEVTDVDGNIIVKADDESVISNLPSLIEILPSLVLIVGEQLTTEIIVKIDNSNIKNFFNYILPPHNKF